MRLSRKGVIIRIGIIFFSPVSVHLVQVYVKKKRANAGYDTTLMPSNDRYPIEEQENWINILRGVKNSCTSRLVFLSCFCSPRFQHTPLPKSHTRQIFSHSSYFQRNLKIVLRTAWKVKRYHSGMKRESEQMATASADKAAGSKFPPKWDNAHARRLHPLILIPRASVSFGHVVGETDRSGRAITGCP